VVAEGLNAVTRSRDLELCYSYIGEMYTVLGLGSNGINETENPKGFHCMKLAKQRNTINEELSFYMNGPVSSQRIVILWQNRNWTTQILFYSFLLHFPKHTLPPSLLQSSSRVSPCQGS
jgi:hypothetical protein